MTRTSSLAFLTLDHHVVHGRADDVALADGDGDVTFAQLLDHVAATAGGLRLLGVADGDPLHVDVVGRARVVAVLSALRLQAVPGTGGAELTGDPAVASVGGEQISWDALRDLGRTDPLPSPASDLESVTAWRAVHADVIDPLLDGRSLQL